MAYFKESEWFEGSFKGLKGKMKVVIKEHNNVYRIMCVEPPGFFSGEVEYIKTNDISEAIKSYKELLEIAKS